MNPDILRQWLPIGISLLSLALSGLAIGWNIYRDVVLKARVRVHFAIVNTFVQGQQLQGGERYLRISVTNHGPGPVRIEIISGQYAPLWKRIVRRPQHFVILNDHTNPLNPRLPHRLEIGDTLNLFLPYDQNAFLNGDATHIGVTDSFGRLHLAPASDVNEARKQYRRDFPKRPPTATAA